MAVNCLSFRAIESNYMTLFSNRKDESKEPIVEVRTEEENTPNQEGRGTTEPNETTPLTEPE